MLLAVPKSIQHLPSEPTASNIKTHADSLLTRLEDAPTDTPAQLCEKATLRAQFTSKLIPTDFVQDLRADRDVIDGKNLTNTADNLQGLESTESISVLLPEASQEVTRLDAMMQNLYSRHPAKLHAWLAASRANAAHSTKRTQRVRLPPLPRPHLGNEWSPSKRSTFSQNFVNP